MKLVRGERSLTGGGARRGLPRILNPNKAGGQPSSMTAAADRIRKGAGDSLNRIAQPWQDRALAYYDIVPEIKFAAQFYARGLSPLRLYAAEVTDSGEIVETKNEAVIEQVRRIQDPGGGGRAGLLATYGRLRFLTGESTLFVTLDPDTNDERWEMLSHKELKIVEDGKAYERTSGPGLNPVRYEDADAETVPEGAKTGVAYRLWQKHPLYSQLADSTMQGVLDVAEELVLLTQAVRARARSRLAGSGILIVNEADLKPKPGADIDEDPQPDEDPNENAFLTDLNEAMLTPILEEGIASAVVPLVVAVDTDNLDNVMKLIQIVDPTQIYPETGLRMEAVKRLAIGLDMPVEVLLGLQDSNHWSAWQVDEQTWKSHLQPVAEGLVGDLTSAFLRPQLREDKVEGYEKYLIWYDETDVVNPPDMTKAATDAYDRIEISGDAYRERLGLDDDESPDDDERRSRIGITLKDIGVALGGDPIAPAPAGPDAGTEQDAPAGPGDVQPGPPEEPASGNGNSPELSGRSERIMGAAEQTVVRARELAGARLRSLAKRDPEFERLIRDVAPHAIPAALGEERAASIGAPAPRDLVKGAAQLLESLFELWGLDGADARTLGQRLERHAAAHLWEPRPRPLPASFASFANTASGRREPVGA